MWVIRKSASPRKVKGQTDHRVEAVSMALIKRASHSSESSTNETYMRNI